MGVVASGNHRNYLGIGVVVGVGLLLYFLPEIVRMVRGAPAPNSTVVTTVNEKLVQDKEQKEEGSSEDSVQVENEQKPLRQVKTADPLTKVLAKIDSGVFDPSTVQNKSEQNLKLDKSPLSMIIRSPKLTWETLAKREVVDITKKALKSSQQFQKVIEPKFQRSSDALTQYITGINNFSRGSLKKLEPRVALDYLGKLDLDVTNALRLDGAPRRLYKQWAKISLGPLVESSGANAKKMEFMPPFVSDVVLTKIEMKEDKINRKRPTVPHSTLKIEAIVAGLDASEVEVFRNGELIGSTKLSKPKKGGLNRKFSFKHKGRAAIRGVFRLRMRDEDGVYLDKVYQFMPNASRFRIPRTGKFDIPEVYVDLSRPISKTVDRYFSIASDQSGRSDGVTYGEFKDVPSGYTAF